MATLYSVNKTIERSITPATILSPGLSGGNVRCFVDTYVGLGTEANLDVIQFGLALPVGATILWGSITQTACGGTPDLGDGVDADAYIDEAGDNAVTMFNDVITGIGKTIAATTKQVTLTLDAAVTLAGVITVVVFYTVE